MAIDQNVLRNASTRLSSVDVLFEKRAAHKSSAFLCHSHKDEELVKGLIVIFKEAGVDLYIDWQDHSMPEQPNAETARKIQERIKSANIFLFLATANSKTSRWCPWEIGFADATRKGIYIIPTSDSTGTYGNEYLQLYPNIDKGIFETNRMPGYFLTKPGGAPGYAISNYNLV